MMVTRMVWVTMALAGARVSGRTRAKPFGNMPSRAMPNRMRGALRLSDAR